MSRTFIRGLWGEGAEGGNPTETLPKTLRDVERCISGSHQPQPLITYAWGRSNAEFLTQRGILCEQVSPCGIENFTDRTRRNCHSKGRMNWGLNFWHHKLRCLEIALEEHEAVVWLDWDYHLVGPLPSDFWDRMAAGEIFQACLRRYQKPQCPWRPYWRPGRGPRYYVPHGAFVYCEELDFIRATRAAHKQQCPEQTDEIAFAWMVDQLTGGWRGPNYYKVMGFEPYCCDHRTRLKPNAVVHKPEVVLFRNVGKW